MSREELIDELATWTSLSRDTLEVLYKESPSLFVNLERVAFTVKTLHLFAQAKDDELVVELFERFVDVLKPHFLPEPLQIFLTAVRAYRVSLEAIRDKVFVPGFDESIYQSYRSMRLVDWKRQDQSPESLSTAFEGAVAEDTTQGTRQEFEEAIQYLEIEPEKLTPPGRNRGSSGRHRSFADALGLSRNPPPVSGKASSGIRSLEPE